ncbi:MAG: Fe-S protein assembly co-chaperone HscB [Bacteroidetes bacterium]|nr:Fe-S protein assembly co-chaperone HscB [Bacteroidota bacterium]
MNPFAFFDLEPRFNIDSQALRKQFLANQRKWHPDFHAGSPDMHRQAVEQTAANNQAYALLSDTYSRVKCMLALHGINTEQEQLLPGDFLMEMMDLNDLIEEAISGNTNSREEAENQLGQYFHENEKVLLVLTESADLSAVHHGYSQEILREAAALYQKHRYLSRLRKNLSGITEL